MNSSKFLIIISGVAVNVMRQAAGAAGGATASLVRVPTEVNAGSLNLMT